MFILGRYILGRPYIRAFYIRAPLYQASQARRTAPAVGQQERRVLARRQRRGEAGAQRHDEELRLEVVEHQPPACQPLVPSPATIYGEKIEAENAGFTTLKYVSNLHTFLLLMRHFFLALNCT